ncbi:MAG: hypothetical protein ACE3K2_05915 [Paenibacillus sp.]|uniref:hypothetical protein n=1 Tax=unclassified Paenibacillus TaxID=185978 RepID=UPI0030DAE553
MELFQYIWIGFMVLLLLYRMFFQKFKKHNIENIGLSAILIVFTGSASLTHMNLIFVISVIAVAVYAAVWNSILGWKKWNEPERLK